jgi:beta-RFAP synthase
VKIKISTPSRLHFGIIDMRGDIGRLHGSAGVTIMKPRLVLEVEDASETSLTGTRVERAREIIDTLLCEKDTDSGVNVNIIEDIPEHMGFGSGTQLSIALGTALNRIFDLGHTFEDMVVKLGRSKRSGIGTLGFQQGGFIVDGGHAVNNPDTVPPLIHRSSVPEDWLFVVCIPDINIGFSGQRETNAFKKLEPPPSDLIASVSRLVLMQMIPSIAERDIEIFGDSMTKLDTMFGNYWATMQGGTYSHPRIDECVNKLLELGSYGAGQSSWGPALYGLVEGYTQARSVVEEMDRFMNDGSNTGTVFITEADNQGAVIE